MQNVELYIGSEQVELFKDETISLTQTIQNVRDIGKVFTEFSKQFNLPANATNNKIFKHYYNYDIENGFDARYKVDALIKLNGADFKKGKVRLNSVSLKDNKPQSYKVVFFGETVALSDALGNDELSVLDLSAYNHNYTTTIVRNGLQTGLTTAGTTSTNRDIIYPLISHTNQYVYDNTGFHLFGDTETTLSYLQLKPAIKVSLILDAIENYYSNITFSEDFFADTILDELYLWLHREKGLITSGGTQQIWTSKGTDFTYSSGDDLIPIDTANIYVFDWTVTPVTGTGNYNVEVRKDDIVIFSELNANGTQTFSFDVNNISFGGLVGLDFKITTASGLITFTTALDVEIVKTAEAGSYVGKSSPSNETMAGEITISEQMPKIKIIDFLTGLFKMFNLTAYLENDIIVVDTLDNYYGGGIAYDISKYVDVQDVEIKRALAFKEIGFAYEKPKTYLINKANNISNFEFGNLNYTGADNYDGGKYEIKVPFEHMLYERMSNQDTGALTQIQWGWFTDDKGEATIAAPLIFFNENRTCSATNVEIDGATVTTYNSPNNVRANDLQTLNFGDETDEYDGVFNSFSLYANYYANYIESLFDIKARIFEYKAYLPLSILLNYNLSDRFVINGRMFKINSVDTNLQTGESKLELINQQVIDLDVTAPSIPSGLALSSPTSSTVLLSWDESTDDVGVKAYKVYLDTVFYGETTGLNMTISGLVLSTSYNYNVLAYDKAGNLSAQSATLTAVFNGDADLTPPSVPTLAAVTQGTLALQLSWSASTGSPTNYKVYRGLSTGTETLYQTLGNVTTYNDTGVSNGVTYFYKVSALDSSGNESALSNEQSFTYIADTTAPTVPTSVNAVQRFNRQEVVDLTWTASTDSSGVAYYEIWRSVDAGAYALLNTEITTAFTDASVVYESEYCYKLKAVDVYDNKSAFSSIDCATLLLPA